MGGVVHGYWCQVIEQYISRFSSVTVPVIVIGISLKMVPSCGEEITWPARFHHVDGGLGDLSSAITRAVIVKSVVSESGWCGSV